MTKEEKAKIIKQIKNKNKEYICCCGQSFSDLYDFRKHLLKKHKEEWYACFEKVKIPNIIINVGTTEKISKEKKLLKKAIEKERKKKHSWATSTMRVFGSEKLPHRCVNIGIGGSSKYTSSKLSIRTISTPMGNKR